MRGACNPVEPCLVMFTESHNTLMPSEKHTDFTLQGLAERRVIHAPSPLPTNNGLVYVSVLFTIKLNH